MISLLSLDIPNKTYRWREKKTMLKIDVKRPGVISVQLSSTVLQLHVYAFYTQTNIEERV